MLYCREFPRTKEISQNFTPHSRTKIYFVYFYYSAGRSFQKFTIIYVVYLLLENHYHASRWALAVDAEKLIITLSPLAIVLLLVAT